MSKTAKEFVECEEASDQGDTRALHDVAPREARTVKNHRLIKLFLIAATGTAGCAAQIIQAHPELCGRPGTSAPVPDGLRWVPPAEGDGTYTSSLFLKNAKGESKIDLGPTLDQICALPGDQLVLFGEFNENYDVDRIDRKTATVIDSFAGRNPMMSPDQHWLIMRPYRHFRSQRSNSEEYLLYDLTGDAEKNRMKGLTPFTEGLVGRPVYPVTTDGVPFEFEDQTREMTHLFRSSAFYWAPDSSAVVFADSVMEKLSIVVVEIQPKGPATLVLPIDVSGVCELQTGDNADYPVPTIDRVDFGSSGALIIHFAPDNSCKSEQRTLRLDDFRPPQPEVHEPPTRREGTLDGVPFHSR
jgi:hypothetical protein